MPALQKAIQHYKNNELNESHQCIAPLLEQNPSSPQLWHFYGVIAARQHHNHLAINCLNKACALSPENGEYLFNLANVYRQASKLEQALATYQKALNYTNNQRSISINYGIALKEHGLYDQALTVFQQMLKDYPDDIQACINLGNIFSEMGQYTPAIAYYEKVIQLNPKCDEAHQNRAHILLTQGNLTEGFEEYEWRWLKNGVNIKPDLTQDLWNGTDLNDKHIFVWGEQGIEQEIIFASVFPDLLQKARQVSIECAPGLFPLFKRSFHQAVVVPSKYRSPEEQSFLADANFQIPSGSLMRLLRKTFDHFPQHNGYLKADPLSVKELNARYYHSDNKMKVGISWASKTESINLEFWEPILSIPDIQFYNLQDNDSLEEIEQIENKLNIKIMNDPDIDPTKSLDDLASQIQTMDLVISISNFTAILAGAMGKSVWVFLPISSDWYWFSNTDGCQWFPDMRLFRQKNIHDWKSVVHEIGDALDKWSSKKVNDGKR